MHLFQRDVKTIYFLLQVQKQLIFWYLKIQYTDFTLFHTFLHFFHTLFYSKKCQKKIYTYNILDNAKRVNSVFLFISYLFIYLFIHLFVLAIIGHSSQFQNLKMIYACADKQNVISRIIKRLIVPMIIEKASNSPHCA